MRSMFAIAALAMTGGYDKSQLGMFSTGRGHGGYHYRKPKRFKQNRRKELKARRK